jgi:hypothetical protein
MTVLHQAGEPVEEADRLGPVLPMGRLHHHSDDGVQAGAVATPRQDSYPL